MGGGQERRRVDGLGGGFRYCKLGPPLFDADGGFSGDVKFNDLAAHIWFTETGEPLPKRVQGTPLLGAFKAAGSADNEPGTALYLLFNGVLGDRRPQGGNVLTTDTLAALPEHLGPRIVYGEGCRLGAERLKRAGVTFKQIPYQVKGV